MLLFIFAFYPKVLMYKNTQRSQSRETPTLYGRGSIGGNGALELGANGVADCVHERHKVTRSS